MSGPVERATDIAAARQVDMLASLLNHDAPPWVTGILPPLGHWLLFPPLARQSVIGIDGHPRRDGGGLLPDVDLPRRMWAGSRIGFLADIPIGSVVERETSLLVATPKEGRSGHMLFATLLHRLSVDGRVAIEEEQDIVYREAVAPGTSAAPPTPPARTEVPMINRVVTPDPVQLFRYSALTFNAHRIHYDRDYATGAEGYPGLVVHGPYLATLLMDFFLSENHAATVTGFSFRAVRPIFDTDRFTLGLTPTDSGADLIVIDVAGGVAMTAQVDTGAR
jgi:3-methylfumaryl-CoA hydratase